MSRCTAAPIWEAVQTAGPDGFARLWYPADQPPGVVVAAAAEAGVAAATGLGGVGPASALAARTPGGVCASPQGSTSTTLSPGLRSESSRAPPCSLATACTTLSPRPTPGVPRLASPR